jgi:hypothetical protein
MRLPELSNFGCLPGKAGGSPFCTSNSGRSRDVEAGTSLLSYKQSIALSKHREYTALTRRAVYETICLPFLAA